MDLLDEVLVVQRPVVSTLPFKYGPSPIRSYYSGLFTNSISALDNKILSEVQPFKS